MIAGIFHQGSGLGDQLFRYITVRTLAEEKGFEWGMKGDIYFKGNNFLSYRDSVFASDFGDGLWVQHHFNEKDVRDANGLDIRSYDPEINFVEDNTIIDGSFEDDKYWGHNLKNINDWLKVEPLEVSDDKCIVGFRGGEYAQNPDLFLSSDYYQNAILKIPRLTSFEVHTDDPTLARQVLPNFKIIDNEPISHSKHTNMGFNWRSARYAKYAIIPNSAFFIIPRLLKHLEDPTAVTIAPRYWARRNTKTWARPACYYKQFTYI